MVKVQRSKNDALPPGLLEESGARRLHVGGTVRKPGWEVLNALPGDHVDHLGDFRDLSSFEDGSFDIVYASHVVEHLGYQKDLGAVLREVARILRSDGRFFVSVPDLEVLARIFVHPDANRDIRFAVMRMMFGGQVDAYDFHYVGLWDDYLATILFEAGFTSVYRVKGFGFFEDTSNLEYLGVPISLNMVARR